MDQQSLPTSGKHTGHAVLTWSGVVEGMRLALPFGASSVLYGLGFGVLAAQVGLSVIAAMVMSATVFSGTAQIAVLQVWSSTQAVVALFAIVMVVNSRYILMSAACRPWLSQISHWKAVAALLLLVDGSFAIGMRERARGEQDAGVLLGAGLISYAGWVVGTGLGYSVGALLPDPRVLALDFMVIAFCASAAALMWKPGLDVWPPVLAAIAACAVQWFVPGAWAVVAAGVTGALVAAMRYRARPEPVRDQ
jgi:predicted branched-subunit amino acid permease